MCQKKFYCNIYVVDERMGSGKTRAAINYMLNAPNEQRFLYITPYREEFETVLKPALESKHFKEPTFIRNRKLNGIKELVKKDYNIISTHALFHLFDRELIDMLRAKGYILIMDEVTDVISKYDLSEDDFKLLLDKFVTVNQETGLLHWKDTEENYDGKFIREKHLCDLQSLALYGKAIMMWLFPIEVFNAFKDIYILTYMFPAQVQRYYYDFYNLNYKYLYVAGNSLDTYKFTDDITERNTQPKDYTKLIEICDNEKMNHIGSVPTELSKTWYDRNKDNGTLKVLQNNVYNFFNNQCKTSSSFNLWTTFKDYKKVLSGKGYTKGFVPINMRAVNSHSNCTSVAYPINRFINPYIKNFFSIHNISITKEDEEQYALSEMLQFIWRSAIRNDEKIQLYIPSCRMRKLLKEWIIIQNMIDTDTDNASLENTTTEN